MKEMIIIVLHYEVIILNIVRRSGGPIIYYSVILSDTYCMCKTIHYETEKRRLKPSSEYDIGA